jgi:arylsulfatase
LLVPICGHLNVPSANWITRRWHDIGYWNISANNHGMMGYKTPNIDRIVSLRWR